MRDIQNHSLSINTVNKFRKVPFTKEEEKRDRLELDFGQTLDILGRIF